jgi:HK97 family phage major capsid protein
MEIQVKNQEQLTKLLDLVEKNLDENRQTKEKIEARIAAIEGKPTGISVEQYTNVKDAVEKHGETLSQINDRLRMLDDALPVGDKIYRPIINDPASRIAQVRDQIARTVLDIACVSRNQNPRFHSEMFKAEKRAQVEEANADGGFLMPIEYRAEIVRIIETYGLARRLARVVPMAHKEWEMPTNSDLPAVYWDTELGALELTAPSESKVTFAKPKLTAHKLIAIDTLSLELVEDAIPSITNFVLDVFAIAISKEEDFQMLFSPGTGAEPFTGLFLLSGITDVTGAANTYAGCLQATGPTGGYNKLIDTMDAADESTADTGVWIFSNSVLNGIRQVKDLNEQPMYGQMAIGAPNTLFGRPYYRSRLAPKTKDGGSQASKAFVLFGDTKYHLMGDRMQLTIDTSRDAAFKEYGMVVRFVERIAFANLLKPPFARLITST